MGGAGGENREFKQITTHRYPEEEPKYLGWDEDFVQVRQYIPKRGYDQLPQSIVVQSLVVNIYSSDIFLHLSSSRL